MPLPARRPRIGSAVPATGLAVAAIMLLAVASEPVQAEPPGPIDLPNRLDQSIVDLARLPPRGPDRAPRLLLVDAAAPTASNRSTASTGPTATAPAAPQPDVVHLAVVSRDRAWAAVAGLDVDLASLRSVRTARLADRPRAGPLCPGGVIGRHRSLGDRAAPDRRRSRRLAAPGDSADDGRSGDR